MSTDRFRFAITKDPAYARRMKLDFIALRRLPPGAFIGRPRGHHEVELLRDLFMLDDQLDPVQWLIEERADLTCRLAILWALLDFRSTLQGLRRLSLMGLDRPYGDSITLDMIDQILEPSGPIHALSIVDPVGTEQINFAVYVLRGSIDLKWMESGLFDSGEQMFFIRQILRYLGTRDAVGWCADQVGREAALWTMERLLSYCRVDRGSDIGNLIVSFNAPFTVHKSNGYEFDAIDVSLGDSGFSMNLRLKVTDPSLYWSNGKAVEYYIRWNGFDRIVDDCGHHYVLRDCRSLGDARDQIILLTFYPAVYAASKSIEFLSERSTVAILGRTGVGGWSYLDEVELGSLYWRLLLG